MIDIAGPINQAYAAFLVRMLLDGHDQFTVFNLLARVPGWERGGSEKGGVQHP